MYKRIYENKEEFKNLGKNQQFILQRIRVYLNPLLLVLHQKMDVRLVNTFYDAFVSLLVNRNRPKGLVISELGGWLLGFEKAIAGTKRLFTLFESEKWVKEDLENFQIKRCQSYIEDLKSKGKEVLGIIDDSTIEKSESWFSEGLCSVHSGKGQRLTRIKPGYYKRPVGRICVPGFEWSALLISGIGLIPMVGLMQWWTKRGMACDSRDNVFYKMLKKIKQVFQTSLILVFDRGFAHANTLEKLFKWEQFFIIRWKSSHVLTNKAGISKNTWRICHQQKAFDKRIIWDKNRQKNLKIEMIFTPVTHPEFPNNPLFLIVIRNKTIKGQQPLYLLTNTAIINKQQAWKIFFSYMQRWDIEQAFHFNKAEIGIESICVRIWNKKLKILALVALVFEFILALWRNWNTAARCLMRKYAHLKGTKAINFRLPLFRLRRALMAILIFITTYASSLQ